LEQVKVLLEGVVTSFVV